MFRRRRRGLRWGGRPLSDGAASRRTSGTTGGVTTGAGAGGATTSEAATGGASAVPGGEVTRRAREAGARSRPRAHLGVRPVALNRLGLDATSSSVDASPGYPAARRDWRARPVPLGGSGRRAPGGGGIGRPEIDRGPGGGGIGLPDGLTGRGVPGLWSAPVAVGADDVGIVISGGTPTGAVAAAATAPRGGAGATEGEGADGGTGARDGNGDGAGPGRWPTGAPVGLTGPVTAVGLGALTAGARQLGAHGGPRCVDRLARRLAHDEALTRTRLVVAEAASASGLRGDAGGHAGGTGSTMAPVELSPAARPPGLPGRAAALTRLGLTVAVDVATAAGVGSSG